MSKEIIITSRGTRADIGNMVIIRILPNRYATSIGPFVFLDHLVPQIYKQTEENAGTGAHPHRGIATLSYILEGEDKHFDSAGHFAKVRSGGIQWMKAGNGIIHDETLVPDPNSNSEITHGFQFWINLPAKHKIENPDYMAIQADDVPKKLLDPDAGWIKIIAGSYEELHSKIPSYTEQFLYHVHLNPGKRFSMERNSRIEYGLFLPDSEALINDKKFLAGDFLQFVNNDGKMEISNAKDIAINILLFGGAPYTEPIVAEGPFVMNSHQELADAYRDFHLGKYGQIDYNIALRS